MLKGGQFENTVQQPLVFLVNLTPFQRFQIDARRLLGGVSHRLTDMGQGHVGVIGGGCPGVTGYVGTQIDGKTKHPRDFVKMFVVTADGTGILLVGLADVGTPENGEEIRASLGGVRLDEAEHLGLDLYLKVLTGLATVVDKASVTDVGMLQIGEVNKGQTSCTEAENERVAGKGQFA